MPETTACNPCLLQHGKTCRGGKVLSRFPWIWGRKHTLRLRGCEGRPVYVDRGLSLVIMRGEGGGRKITFLPRRRRKYAMPTTRTNERTNHSPGDLGGWKEGGGGGLCASSLRITRMLEEYHIAFLLPRSTVSASWQRPVLEDNKNFFCNILQHHISSCSLDQVYCRSPPPTIEAKGPGEAKETREMY